MNLIKLSLLVLFLFLTPTLAFSQDFQALLDKGDEFYEAKEYTEAVKYFSEAIKADPNQVKGWWYRADAYRLLKNNSEAIADYTKALELDERVNFYQRRGDCYYNSGQYTEAEIDYNRALELEPENALYWFYRGDCYVKLNNLDKACEDYQKADQLGNEKALEAAQSISCEWANNIEELPCPKEEFGVSKVEINPFTGTVFVSKGLEYDKFEIKRKDQLGFISAAEIGLNDKFTIKILKPKGFCLNRQNEALPGIGFEILDTNKEVLGGIENLNKDNDGMSYDILESLTLTLNLTEPMKIGDKYILKAHFFDTRSKAEVWATMPYTIASETKFANSIQTNTSTFKEGINSAAVESVIKSFSFETLKNKKIEEINRKSEAQLRLSGVENINNGASYTLRWIDSKGEILNEQTGKINLKKEEFVLPLNHQTLASGEYQIWLKVQDETSPNTIGMVMKATVK
jgi:predicted negative regulator of RcsB-dependent stress response